MSHLYIYFTSVAYIYIYVCGNREKRLRQLESKYILMFNSKTPHGMNIDEDLHVHLN